jgi:hypothetical protein
VFSLSKKKGFDMESNFALGFICGFVSAGIIGFIWGQIGKASSTIKQRNRPLDTFPDASQPHLTPAGIVWKSTKARVMWVFWVFVLLFFIIFMFKIPDLLLY